MSVQTLVSPSSIESGVMGVGDDLTGFILNVFTSSEPGVREYMANALDQHQKHGVNRPVETKMTKAYDKDGLFKRSFLSVRDYGQGMTKEELISDFIGFNNGENGSLRGLGSKAALHEKGTFFVTSYRNGLKNSASITRGEDDSVTYEFTEENVPSTEPTGTEVKFICNPYFVCNYLKRFKSGEVTIDGKDCRSSVGTIFTNGVWEYSEHFSHHRKKSVLVRYKNRFFEVDTLQTFNIGGLLADMNDMEFELTMSRDYFVLENGKEKELRDFVRGVSKELRDVNRDIKNILRDRFYENKRMVNKYGSPIKALKEISSKYRYVNNGETEELLDTKVVTIIPKDGSKLRSVFDIRRIIPEDIEKSAGEFFDEESDITYHLFNTSDNKARVSVNYNYPISGKINTFKVCSSGKSCFVNAIFEDIDIIKKECPDKIIDSEDFMEKFDIKGDSQDSSFFIPRERFSEDDNCDFRMSMSSASILNEIIDLNKRGIVVTDSDEYDGKKGDLIKKLTLSDIVCLYILAFNAIYLDYRHLYIIRMIKERSKSEKLEEDPRFGSFMTNFYNRIMNIDFSEQIFTLEIRRISSDISKNSPLAFPYNISSTFHSIMIDNLDLSKDDICDEIINSLEIE